MTDINEFNCLFLLVISGEIRKALERSLVNITTSIAISILDDVRFSIISYSFSMKRKSFFSQIFAISSAFLIVISALPLQIVGAVSYSAGETLAQVDSSQIAFNRPSNSRGMHLGGVLVHSYGSGDKAMYVYDSGNNRILGYFNPTNLNTDTPEIVFGQSGSYTTSACNGNSSIDTNPTADTLCLNRGSFAISQEEEPRYTAMDTDTNGNLFVLDQYNNRVLAFYNPFGSGTGEGDSTADYVWAQANFTSKTCNRGAGYPSFPSTSLVSNGICTSKNITASTDLFLGGSVDIDSLGNLWVTDTVNNRVLRFPFDAINSRPADSADIVFGQPNMQSFTNGYNSCGTVGSGAGLCQAYVVATDPSNNEVYVAHGNLGGSPNHRITVYTPNISATAYTYNREFGSGTLNVPRSITMFDSTSILVGDVRAGQSDRILHYDKSGTLLHTITNAQISGSTPDSAVDIQEINGQMTLVGNLLYVSEQRTHNSILILDATNLSSLGTLSYSGEMLGGPNYVWNNITSQGMQSPFGMALSESHDQLFSSDKYRVLVWDTSAGVTTDQAASFVIGQPNLTSNATSSSSYFKDKVSGIAVDEINNKLWVARNQEIFAFNLPITSNNPTAVKNFVTRIPSSIYLGNIAVSGQPDNLVFNAWSLAFDETDESLWIVDSLNSRVVRVSDPYGTATADLFFGQNSISGTQCNRNNSDKSHPTSQTLCNPSDAEFDSNGNLYIAEGVYEGRLDRPGNKRIVEYDRATIDAAALVGPFSEPAADRVYGASSFTMNPLYSKGGCLSNTPCNPISISFDSQDRMLVLVDAYFNDQSKRIFIYDNPLKNTGYVAFNVLTDPILTFPMGQGGFSAFDASDNLYIQDHTWNRINYVTLNANTAPTAPSYTTPADTASLVNPSVTLNWTASTDPDFDPIKYDVYFGTTSGSLSLVSVDQTGLSYNPSSLSYNTTYYWQVVAKDDQSNSTPGVERSFSIQPNAAPAAPSLTAPTNLAVNQRLNASLTWGASTDPNGDPVTYDVYLGGTALTMTLVSADQVGTSYVTSLAHSNNYYWQIIAEDNYSNSTPSPVRSFSTYQVLSTPSNLALGQSILNFSNISSGSASDIVDGTKFSNGTPNDITPAVYMTSTLGQVSVDLGSANSINSVTFQADSNDSYRIQTSANGTTWSNYGTATTAAPGASTGFVTKTVTVARSNVRYVRIKPISGDSNYRISEIEVYP